MSYREFDKVGNPDPQRETHVEQAVGRNLHRYLPNPVPSPLHGRDHHRSHPKQLYVVTVVSNPIRFKSRYKLYKEFERHMHESEVTLITVEQALGDRHFAITDKGNPNHVQVRTFDELWHKENMINLGIQRVLQNYPDAEYLAWIDADVEFTRKDWVNETLHQLQHHMVVQLFQNAIDLGPDGETMKIHTGFAASYLSGAKIPMPGEISYYGYGGPGNLWHPGYAWAARREALDGLGGLYDVSILGSGDHLMAWALIGHGAERLPSSMSKGYRYSLQLWENNAEKFIQRDIGFVHGTILHAFHGPKAARNYKGRWKILEEFKFDPFTDLKKDVQGLFQLNMGTTTIPDKRMIGLRDAIRRYFRARNEDSISKE